MMSSAGSLSAGPTGERRILQIHPTLRCNLACAHCYSSSGPTMATGLDRETVLRVVADAHGEGYNVVSFSGGEPFVYTPLAQVCEAATALGMFVTVTTNGLLLNEKRLLQFRNAIQLLAISLDGIPASHDRMRGRSGAFKSLEKRLEGVRRSGIPFGFIFTLTQHNVHELQWVAEFAVGQGARLLQIHPLEEVGRAAKRLGGCRPDDGEMAFAYLQAELIRAAFYDRLLVHVDFVDLDQMKAAPERVFADDMSVALEDARLADLISPLVVQADGYVVPLQYGFSRRYALGNLHDNPLSQLAETWRRETYGRFRLLCKDLYDTIYAGGQGKLFGNWYEAVTIHSARDHT